MENELLVKCAKQGDKNALVQLIMDKQQEYYKLAFVYMKNKEDAMDALEEMIVKLYENIHRLKKDDAFYSWSKTILVNCCKSGLKTRNRIIPIEGIKEDACDGELKTRENQILLEECMQELDVKHQEVIKLRYYLDMDYQTISEILKIPLGTVKSRIFNGLKKLKEGMGGDSCEGC